MNPGFFLKDVMDRGLPSTVREELSIAPQAVLTGEQIVQSFKRGLELATVEADQKELQARLRAASTPLQVATAVITARYNELGGASGFLGATTTAVTVCSDGQGYFRHFQGGSIYWHVLTGAHEVHGLIRKKWAELGWERSYLGYPTTDETMGRDPQSSGRFNHFQRGAIYWHPKAGAHEVHGAILRKYLVLGGEGSFLGYPTTDETTAADGVGRYNHFQAGSIYWKPDTSAHELHGLIRDHYAEHGWEKNASLGYPISDELVPSLRAGHARPETKRKPNPLVPADVIKLPTLASPTPLPGGLTPMREKSRNRFSDFENGVMFWQRGSNEAKPLAPWTQAADGRTMQLTPQDIAQALRAHLESALKQLSGVSFLGLQYFGTTGYKYDGSGVRNRRHRMNVMLRGIKELSLGLVDLPQSTTTTFELQVEVAYEPVKRKVVGFFAEWAPGAGNNELELETPLVKQLHKLLDPLLWTRFDLLSPGEPEPGMPLTLLSAKTMTNGNVFLYIEPR